MGNQNQARETEEVTVQDIKPVKKTPKRQRPPSKDRLPSEVFPNIPPHSTMNISFEPYYIDRVFQGGELMGSIKIENFQNKEYRMSFIFRSKWMREESPLGKDSGCTGDGTYVPCGGPVKDFNEAVAISRMKVTSWIAERVTK